MIRIYSFFVVVVFLNINPGSAGQGLNSFLEPHLTVQFVIDL